MIRSRLTAALVVLLVPLLAHAAEPFRYTEGTHGSGRLRYIHDLPVLTVAGTPEEIGEQIAVLTATPLQRLVKYPRAALEALHVGFLMPQLIKVSNAMLPQFPADHRRELEAMAKRAGVPMDLAVLGNTLPDILKTTGCSTIIVQPGRSAVKGPLFGRNLDYYNLGFLHDYSLVTVYRPKGKHAFAAVGFPGMVGCISGMNDAGLALATLEVYSSKDGAPKLQAKGVPYALTYRRILEECTTVAEAEKLLRSLERTTMNNLAICDPHGGAVFEITSRSLVVRRPIEDICCCTNHFRTPELATSTQCRRFEILSTCRELPRIDLATVAQKLHAANQGEDTLQTMIFEPASLKLHLAIGKPPSSGRPMKTLDLVSLMKP
jgi:hypothetical protein